ncbi:MAG: insulinase family protein [Tannerella sp.]|jgi:zinc protease|nr:insulinase family protein [Tannerella sp.]
MKYSYLLIVLCGFSLISLIADNAFAQSSAIGKLPIDPKVRYGKLSNGMTYYIRHNEMPRERAEFYIVQNVGSMQEEENQRGLAHFLEHMAFNGTKNFPAGTLGIKEYTERIGMRFGENLNAYTSFDETVYMLMNVPVARRETVDTCLLILHDWAAFLTLADSMIEKERGIIREEWRTRSDAQMRLWEQQLPRMYPGSRYANRLPVGTIDVINHFRPDELRAYYRKWYRPDLQGIIIVGDVDAEAVEETVKTMFADIPAPVDPAERRQEPVPDNDEPLVSIATDKEATRITLSLYYKHDNIPDEIKGTIADYMKYYLGMVVSSVMSERFSEILQKANPPFINAYAGDGAYMIARTKDAWTTAAIVKPGSIDEALETLVTETGRVKKFGFTASEYDRARTNILKWIESAYNERDNQQNDAFANEYVRHFTDGECIPGIEMEYEMMKQIAPAIPVEAVNQYVSRCIGDSNIVIGLTGPDHETYPSEEELLAAFREKQAIPVEGYEEETAGMALIDALPAPGEIVGTRQEPLFGATVYTLGNGVRVVLKETDYKKDQIVMKASSPGGSTLFDAGEASNLKLLNNVASVGGLGNFSTTQLAKALAGKKISCSIQFTGNAEGINGETAPSDIRTLFELVYLFFTAPRSDDEAYASLTGRLRGQLENLQLNPMVAFSDSATKAVYGDNPLAGRIRTDDLDRASYSRIMEMYRERFADASDFTFIFVGNISTDSMIPMMKQYLATLPSLKRAEQGNSERLPVMRQGKYTNRFSRTMETPKATVMTLHSGQMTYNLENLVLASMLNQILDLVYTEKVRENESGSYHVGTNIHMADFPKGRTILQISFDTDPAMQDKLTAIVRDELAAIVRNGPRETDFVKTRDNMLKRHDESLQENSYWLGTLDGYYFYGFDGFTSYKDVLNSIMPAQVQEFAKELVEQGNYVEVVMTPEI